MTADAPSCQRSRYERASDDTGDVVRALADDLLLRFPPDDGDVEPETVYQWLIGEADRLDWPARVDHGITS